MDGMDTTAEVGNVDMERRGGSRMKVTENDHYYSRYIRRISVCNRKRLVRIHM